MIWLILALVLLAAVFLFLLFPAPASREARETFGHRVYAHRGLYEPDQSIPENSLPAFRRAVEAGYGAELDVQLTKDGYIVVLHDDDLKRSSGLDSSVCDHTLAELQALPLFGTEERIPLFSDVLRIFDGRQPLIVELKSAAPNVKELCEAVRLMLADYKGPACVESFHPEVVRYFRLNDPSRVRGQLSEAACAWKGKMPAWKGFAFSRLLTNFRARPHFIAYGLGPKPWPVRLCESLGAMKVCWTAREETLHAKRMKEYDAVIFEGYRPPKNQ
jgi:glycerophosphoryl diester phosphodiesterase